MGGVFSKPDPTPAPAPAAPPVEATGPVDTPQMKQKRISQAQLGAASSSTGINGPANFATKTLLGQ